MYHDNRNNCDCRLSKRQIRSEMLKIRDSLDPSFVLSAADCLEKEFFRLFSAETEKDDPEPREETIPARKPPPRHLPALRMKNSAARSLSCLICRFAMNFPRTLLTAGS